MKHLKYILLSLLLTSFICASEFEPTPNYEAANWYKGNTHTHTTNSDGDSEPAVVAAWYREHGYDFLVLTDHNKLTAPEEALIEGDSMLIIPGEEVSAIHTIDPQTRKPIHVNALDLEELVSPVSNQETLAATIQGNIDAIRDADGIPHINHPNFRWAFGAPELLKVDNYNLLEVYNGHPLVNNEGDGDHLGMEAVWDTLLTEGRRIYGIGVDDAHHFKGEFAPDRSNPGRCWVMVKANALETGEIMEALESGDFYSTTGVELISIEITADEYRIELKSDQAYRVEFIGQRGEILYTTDQNPATYKLNGSEDYVRAKVYDESGHFAWTQPVFVH